jgi:DHA1 family inner membrane transport protein
MAVPAFALVMVVGALGSVLAINLQIRLMHAAGDAQMLGAALNHSALNIANGLGAWLGSLVIAAGYGFRAPSLVGAALAVFGLLIFAVGLAASRGEDGA